MSVPLGYYHCSLFSRCHFLAFMCCDLSLNVLVASCLVCCSLFFRVFFVIVLVPWFWIDSLVFTFVGINLPFLLYYCSCSVSAFVICVWTWPLFLMLFYGLALCYVSLSLVCFLWFCFLILLCCFCCVFGMCRVFLCDLVLICALVLCYLMTFLLFKFRVVVFVFIWKLKKNMVKHSINKQETHLQGANQT